MGGMIVQEISRLAEDQIDKLICYGTGPRGNIPGRFETIDQSREKLKTNGLEVTANRIAKTWFIDEERAKYFYLCDQAGKQASMEATDNGLIAMKNWDGVKNLKIIYGGSVNTKNALQLFALESVDGGLIGRASLDVSEFVSICTAATPSTN